MIRILLVDGHPIVRVGMATVLEQEPGFSVVGDASTGEQALREIEQHRPDVVVLDVRIPGMDGVELCRKIISHDPGICVIALASLVDAGSIMIDAFGAGARGFLLKESEPSAFRHAVRTVSAGGTFTDPRVAARLAALATRRASSRDNPFQLTYQELRVVGLLPRGLSNKEIGRELGIATTTVKTHLYSALRKLGAKDRVEAAAIALREGLA